VKNTETVPFVRVVTSSLFEENAYLLSLAEGGDCIVVDPGLDADQIVEALQAAGLNPLAILNTHGHGDHIAGNELLKQTWPDAPLIIGAGDAWKLTDPEGNLSAEFGMPMVSPPADQTVSEGDVLEFAGIRWTVLETPGHSRGHVVFVATELSPIIVLGGDVLFAGSVGRSDLADGDHETLLDSIRTKLFPLPDNAVVLPGHGPPTTIGRERRTNPFLRGL
jgi:hydroxyacylglutathione hydrolase